MLLDVSSRNQRWGKRRGNSTGGNNFSYNEGQNRKPTPQKYRNTWDKRPRQRGEYTPGSGGDVSKLALLHEFWGEKNDKGEQCHKEAAVVCLDKLLNIGISQHSGNTGVLY